MTTATATERNGNGGPAQSGSSAPDAIGSSYQVEAAGGPIALRPASNGPTGNGNGSGPGSRGDSVALTCERNAAEDAPVTVDGEVVELTAADAWYVGPGRPGVIRQCDHCGREYQARRSSSRFCSTRCRGLAWQAEHA